MCGCTPVQQRCGAIVVIYFAKKWSGDVHHARLVDALLSASSSLHESSSLSRSLAMNGTRQRDFDIYLYGRDPGDRTGRIVLQLIDLIVVLKEPNAVHPAKAGEEHAPAAEDHRPRYKPTIWDADRVEILDGIERLAGGAVIWWFLQVGASGGPLGGGEGGSHRGLRTDEGCLPRTEQKKWL